MTSSISNLVNNLAKGSYKMKCKYGHDYKQSKNYGIKYKDCKCCLQYTNVNNDFKCTNIYVVTIIMKKN